jgi:hypothetical protein
VLTTLLLLRAGYAYVPYTSLERVIEENKDLYYKALRRTQSTLENETPDWEPWVGFFLRCLKKQKDSLDVRLDRERIAQGSEADLPELSLQILRALRTKERLGGASRDVPAEGAWLDTVTLHGPYVAESWTGAAPSGLAGAAASCPTSIELNWSGVAGAGGYRVYRSEISCVNAIEQVDAFATTVQPEFSDDAAVTGIQYHYVVSAFETGTVCSSARTCVSVSCPCLGPPADPSGLCVSKSVADVRLSWDDPLSVGLGWNVYRGTVADPSTWGPPQAAGIGDQEPEAPGIQHHDAGALATGRFVLLSDSSRRGLRRIGAVVSTRACWCVRSRA